VPRTRFTLRMGRIAAAAIAPRLERSPRGACRRCHATREPHCARDRHRPDGRTPAPVWCADSAGKLGSDLSAAPGVTGDKPAPERDCLRLRLSRLYPFRAQVSPPVWLLARRRNPGHVCDGDAVMRAGTGESASWAHDIQSHAIYFRSQHRLRYVCRREVLACRNSASASWSSCRRR
jgi:hypothetical protein